MALLLHPVGSGNITEVKTKSINSRWSVNGATPSRGMTEAPIVSASEIRPSPTDKIKLRIKEVLARPLGETEAYRTPKGRVPQVHMNNVCSHSFRVNRRYLSEVPGKQY